LASAGSGIAPSFRTNDTMSVAGGREISPLPQPHQQVIDLGGLGLGLDPSDLTESECTLLPLVVEYDAITAVSLLKRGHVPPQLGDASPMRLEYSYQALTKGLN
jgi:hypothetical protein